MLYFLYLFQFSTVLITCSNCKDTTKSNQINNVKPEYTPTGIAQNLSIVTARVDEVIFKTETDYQIKVTVLGCRNESDAYTSITTPS